MTATDMAETGESVTTASSSPPETTTDCCERELPPTKMLYMTYEGNWLTECKAQVLSVQKQENRVVEVCLDQTVMHAQGGGQPTDVGQLFVLREDVTPAVKVDKVIIDRDTGVAKHTGTMVQGAIDLEPGDTVKVAIDTEMRRILSECHSAGHVVDSAMAACGKTFKPSKAYHFLESPYVEYEGTVPADERDRLLQDLQTSFCHLVNQDIPTKIELMSKGEADALCNRQAQNFDMDVFADKRTNQIRVVTVAGFPCPCGGTHVKSTADLKKRQWGITGFKSRKGVIRVKYGQGVKPS